MIQWAESRMIEWEMESYLGQDELFGTKPVNTLRMSEANFEVGYLWERACSGGLRLKGPSRIVLQSGFHSSPSSTSWTLPYLTLPRWIYLLFFFLTSVKSIFIEKVQMQRNEQREIWSCNFYSIFFFLLFYFDLAISSQSFNLRLWFSYFFNCKNSLNLCLVNPWNQKYMKE